jgi:hypothetical protein
VISTNSSSSSSSSSMTPVVNASNSSIRIQVPVVNASNSSIRIQVPVVEKAILTVLVNSSSMLEYQNLGTNKATNHTIRKEVKATVTSTYFPLFTQKPFAYIFINRSSNSNQKSDTNSTTFSHTVVEQPVENFDNISSNDNKNFSVVEIVAVTSDLFSNVSNISDVSDVFDVSDVSKVFEVSGVSGVSEVYEVYKVSEFSNISEASASNATEFENLNLTKFDIVAGTSNRIIQDYDLIQDSDLAEDVTTKSEIKDDEKRFPIIIIILYIVGLMFFVTLCFTCVVFAQEKRTKKNYHLIEMTAL